MVKKAEKIDLSRDKLYEQMSKAEKAYRSTNNPGGISLAQGWQDKDNHPLGTDMLYYSKRAVALRPDCLQVARVFCKEADGSISHQDVEYTLTRSEMFRAHRDMRGNYPGNSLGDEANIRAHLKVSDLEVVSDQLHRIALPYFAAGRLDDARFIDSELSVLEERERLQGKHNPKDKLPARSQDRLS